ncbi:MULTISPECIES: ASCH domain-containing protein [Rhizobium]|uniref:Putative transcriptional regulator n=1 Tax=Rhizobium paranaense TaxID=1650438 RepID=A0A7W8XWR9_9HYPH|nr:MULTISPECIES: ASCH domain-containing protein [Rhizobium]MBB5576976.1 putative transcriptional regulator [Rhizobium paranaense]
MSENAIISIRPKFVQAIVSGVKTVEVRRRIPPIQAGTTLWIYATLPIGAVVAVAVAVQIFRGHPDELWASFGAETGITKEDFDSYFEGTASGVCIYLGHVREISPIPIRQLRSMRVGFNPPQVISKITAEEARFLEGFSRPV